MYVLTVMGKASVATVFEYDIAQRQGLEVSLRSLEFLAQKDVLQLQAKPPRRAPHGHDSKRRR